LKEVMGLALGVVLIFLSSWFNPAHIFVRNVVYALTSRLISKDTFKKKKKNYFIARASTARANSAAAVSVCTCTWLKSRSNLGSKKARSFSDNYWPPPLRE
jgi:hypothetical protein